MKRKVECTVCKTGLKSSAQVPWVWQPAILVLICIESVAVWRGAYEKHSAKILQLYLSLLRRYATFSFSRIMYRVLTCIILTGRHRNWCVGLCHFVSLFSWRWLIVLQVELDYDGQRLFSSFFTLGCRWKILLNTSLFWSLVQILHRLQRKLNNINLVCRVPLTLWRF